MSDLLDVDLTNEQVAYHVFVERADEFEPVVREWYIAAHGHPPARANMHFLYWRVISERLVWKTLRHALETEWHRADQPPRADQPSSDVPVGGPPAPLPAPPIAGPPPSGGVGGVIRVTNDSDGEFAPRMMSDRANAWVNGGTAYVFAGSRNSGGPQFFAVDLASGSVKPLGPLIPYVGETEFWYWTPNGLLMVAEGPRLHRVNPFTGGDEVVMDASSIPGALMIDQWHSSDDGTTHSATVKNGAYQKIGTVTLHHGKLEYWPAVGELDESQVRRDGRGVLIKENRGTGDDNRYIDLDTRVTTWLRDQERAIQHSDCGPDYVVGEADKPDPGACVIWSLDRLNEGPRILFHTLNQGYVSTRAGKCLWSNDTHLSLVAVDGSGVTPLIEHGATLNPRDPNYYDLRPKANLSPCGRVACYMVNGSVLLLVI